MTLGRDVTSPQCRMNMWYSRPEMLIRVLIQGGVWGNQFCRLSQAVVMSCAPKLALKSRQFISSGSGRRFAKPSMHRRRPHICHDGSGAASYRRLYIVCLKGAISLTFPQAREFPKCERRAHALENVFTPRGVAG
jgi:hypothetical protein